MQKQTKSINRLLSSKFHFFETFNKNFFQSPEYINDLATKILYEFLPYRRMTQSGHQCKSSRCQICLRPHLPLVEKFISLKEPITFVLPAFPGKSPNPYKVLSPKPDMAEKKALNFLNHLCKRITHFYRPGAKIILCSDGRVFNDVIGMGEEDITQYQKAIEKIIHEENLKYIKTFNLDQISLGNNFSQHRSLLLEKYGISLEQLKKKVKMGNLAQATADEREALRMYRGITRFLMEDSLKPQMEISRSALQKECRKKAYQVILRSNAWSKLISQRFPQAVRLSIHPQECGSKKLGIQLIGSDNWMTPWHGVAVDVGHDFILLKKWEAEKLPTELIYDHEGNPSHYKLIS